MSIDETRIEEFIKARADKYAGVDSKNLKKKSRYWAYLAAAKELRPLFELNARISEAQEYFEILCRSHNYVDVYRARRDAHKTALEKILEGK